MIAVVGGEEDDRVIELTETLQRIEQPSQCLIQPFDHAIIAAQMGMGRSAQCRQIGWNPLGGVLFTIAIGWWIVIEMVLMMRLDVGDKEKEGILLIGIDIADGGVGQCIDAVAGQLDLLAVVVKHHGVVGVRGEFEQIRCQPVLIAATLGFGDRFFQRQMPLADVTSGVTGAAESAAPALSGRCAVRCHCDKRQSSWRRARSANRIGRVRRLAGR